jgi:hypothetical protein
MVELGKYFLLFLVVTLVASSTLIIEQSNAQTIPNPSPPEFSYKFLENTYHPTIAINITNQAYPSTVNGTEAQLYYNIRTKNHIQDNWTEQYVISASTLPSQSSTGFTELIYTPNYSTGDKVDLQVKALLGYYVYTTPPEHPTLNLKLFTTQSSDWSPTQTFTMPKNPTPQPSTSTFYLSENTLLAIIAAIAIVALTLAILSLILLQKRR